MRHVRSSPKHYVTIRRACVVILSVLCVLSTIGFMFAHWSDRQLLNTDNWVAMVGPLPKNDKVATALGDYSVGQLYSGINLQQKVAAALPPRAGFLAGPLSDQIETRSKQLAKRSIESDGFQQVWISANRATQSQLVEKARGKAQPDGGERASFVLRLKDLKGTIVQKLGRNSDSIFQWHDGGPDLSLAVGLKTSFQTFKRFVNITDFLNGVLWLVSVACLLGALVLAVRRRRLVLILSGTFAVIALLQLIGTRALRPALLNQVQNVSYRPAAGVIYDDLLSTFRHASGLLLAASLLSFIIAFLYSEALIKRSRQASKLLRLLKQSGPSQAIRSFRALCRHYRFHAMGLATFAILLYMAFVPQFDWRGVIRAILVIIVLCELISLFSARAVNTGRRKPI